MNKREKIGWICVLTTLLPLWAFAQPAQLITSVRTIDTGKTKPAPEVTTEVAAQQATTAVNAMTLPLFGEVAKTPVHIEWEINFLSSCDQNFSSRDEASQFFAARAWDYLNEGQLDTAAYRFNLAYLLNERNAETYWGLGVVTYQRGQLPESIRLLKKGVEVVDTNATLITDLATVQLKYFQENKDSTLLKEAVNWLHKSAQLNPAYANTFMRLSWASYIQGSYNEAWTYLHKAREIELSAIDLSYLEQLVSKQPDPQNIFK
ncbi:tetratricopeptide repeat protein [Tellurirhabdus bombi]|uniref:tetratricopeptide repeat protein n=1 Tax=Tellurirhabdus bombi TaxID=2907205 RepID=UPI001F3F8E3F|nr:tetratricopeptide repeat protein [Tellurirhabdus bombi]